MALRVCGILARYWRIVLATSARVAVSVPLVFLVLSQRLGRLLQCSYRPTSFASGYAGFSLHLTQSWPWASFEHLIGTNGPRRNDSGHLNIDIRIYQDAYRRRYLSIFLPLFEHQTGEDSYLIVINIA